MEKKNFEIFAYSIKFIACFALLYFGTAAFIGLAAPGNYYLPFLDKYLNYVAWLRSSLLFGVKSLVGLMGIESFVKDIYTLRVSGGRGVHVGFDCLGYGVLSFWAAFIFANSGRMSQKIKWLLGGFLLVWILNVTRISLVLISLTNHWPPFLSLDHHTLFNIAAYTAIFIMMYFFDKSQRKYRQPLPTQHAAQEITHLH